MLSALKDYNQKEIFENYVASALKYITNNTAEQEQRTILKMSYNDIIHPVTQEMEQDNEKQAGDIVANIRDKLGRR